MAFENITPERRRAIRAEMLMRWKQKLRKKGAAKKAGGDPAKAGGSGSMKGFAWQGAASMKQKSKGGTVGKGTHKAVAGQKGGGTARIAAKAWRTKHMTAAGTDKAKRGRIQRRFKHMIGK